MFRKALFLPILFFVFACGGGEEIKDLSECHFEQEKMGVPVGTVVVERNSIPFMTGSAFLIHKEDGRFVTNRHVIEWWSKRENRHLSIKIFFECRSYNISEEDVDNLHDAAVVYIKDDFDSSVWPEPYPLFRDSVRVGDTVYAQGVHSHIPELRSINKKAGIDNPRYFILRDYYGIKRGGRGAYTDIDSLMVEFTFDNMRARVYETGFTPDDLRRRRINMNVPSLEASTNRFFGIRLYRDHGTPLGGLSGGPVLINKEGTFGVVGLVTAGVMGNNSDVFITPIMEIPEMFVRHRDNLP